MIRSWQSPRGLLTELDQLVYATVPFAFKQRQPNGSVVIYGKATDETLDSDEQIQQEGFQENVEEMLGGPYPADTVAQIDARLERVGWRYEEGHIDDDE